MTEGVAPRVNGHAVVKDPPLVAGVDRLMLVTVVVHFLIAVGHTAMHRSPDAAQLVVLVVVVLALPVYAIFRHYRHRGTAGAVLLVVSLAASFLAGFFSGPGDVARGWALAFTLTAVLLAAVDLFGTALAVAVLRRRVRIS